MADDNTLTVSIRADTSDFESGINAVNNALGYTAAKANDTRNPIAEMFGALQKSSDQAVAGIIKGSETWRQAMLNVAQELEIKFVQLNVNRLINAIETELGITNAAMQGNTARTASDQSANTASNALRGQQALGAIYTDAAETYGGVFAFLAPEMGPAAAGPAGVAEAQVLSQASLVSLDVGAWSVPQNMPAFLHAGEMVVPQTFASGLRDGGGLGGGGDSYTININAIDTQTGAQFLKNNASVIAQTISSQARNFNRNVPVWKT